ncbi:MAG TPA: hypothetical protein PK286_11635 [Devosia sp.]|nr:hypothetical protein [Devosia sp.]
MVKELLVAGIIMAVGVSIAGMGTHLYQMIRRQPALLRYEGQSAISMFGHLAMSFVCGPYIMLQSGWQQERDGALSVASALVSAFVAFGWAFITGLVVVGSYMMLAG